ncbi:MAG: PilZ domain-containing protein [Methylomonas lenta]|nr:PilZ domain-containing protein [Methylomonas lenta]
MLNATADRRRFFRVDDTISLSYQLIDENTAAQGLKSSGYLNSEYSLAATLDVLSQEAMRIMQHLEKQNSEFLELYKVLDAKINVMAQAVMFVGSNVDAQDCQDVNLSAAGLAFQQPTALELGQNLAIEMYLPSTLALILVYGKVINCQAVDAGQYVISVEYTQIREEDQELLIKHVVRKQWQQLRESKSNVQAEA